MNFNDWGADWEFLKNNAMAVLGGTGPETMTHRVSCPRIFSGGNGPGCLPHSEPTPRLRAPNQLCRVRLTDPWWSL